MAKNENQASATDEVVSRYSATVVDGDFVVEWQEGSNRAETMRPKEMAALYELQQKAKADRRRASQGIHRRIID